MLLDVLFCQTVPKLHHLLLLLVALQVVEFSWALFISLGTGGGSALIVGLFLMPFLKRARSTGTTAMLMLKQLGGLRRRRRIRGSGCRYGCELRRGAGQGGRSLKDDPVDRLVRDRICGSG